MIKRLVIAAVIFGIASLAGFLLSKKSIGISSVFAVDNAVIEENDRVVINGTIPPRARPEFDVGPTDPSLPMKRTILLLKIAPEKQAELDRLVAEQQDPSSPNFHCWLTPEEFGKRFGRTPEEIATVKGWLISHGFTIDETAKGGTWINFSGTAADVDRAFHANMHDYQVDGLLRHANSTDPSIPRALAGLVAGPVSLHNFSHKAAHTPPRHMPETKLQPGYTESDGSHDIAPGDFAAIYNVNNVYNMGYDGTGVTVAIVERTHPNVAKWNFFRSTFGLPYNPPVVIVNGPDPGDLGSNEDLEADLDVEWSGAVATGATINVVISATTNSADGVDLSAQYIVNNNLAPIMSDCFETCEPELGSTWSSFYYNLWEQAASQGITVFVVTGDSGAYDCTNARGVPIGGKAVNGLASTPFNIAVGGTALSDASAYWNPVNSTDGVAALGYMPEVAWNQWPQQYWASGGGASTLWGKPAWQVCPGVPNDGARDVPDVSLSADTNVGYRVYTCINATGTTCPSNSWSIIGGTSGASPPLAGIMALIVQSAGGKRQGNFNTAFYQLGNAQYSGAGGASAVFHDITLGNNGFGSNFPGYSCTAQYDLVTGLGSVDATNLLLAFQGEGALMVTISPTAAVNAGAQWNVDGGAWQNSGATVENLSVGSHTVNFSTIAGWTTPASQAVNIVKGQTASAGGLYVQQTQTGSLKGTISPTAAVNAGAQWNVDGGTWQNSGATVGGLAVGSHTVNFNTITGWTSPASQSVNIVNGQTASAGGIYVQQTGSLTVTISPAGAVSAGAQWNVDGGTWQNSGATVGNLSVGSHTVNFNTITGWTSPASQSVNIANGQTTSAGGLYVQQTQTGSLKVTISPTAAVNAGAMWNVDSGAWNASGGTVSGLSVGSHAVNFESIPGWNTPAGQNVFISSGLTTKASAKYVFTPPTVESFLIDNGAGTTSSRTVTLNNTATGSPTYYMASQSSTFYGAAWKPYSTAPPFTLSAANGPKTVYFKVKNAGGVSEEASASIVLAQLPAVTSFKIDQGAATTINQTVTLNNTATMSPTQFRASEDPNFTGASWHAYSTAPKFMLSPGGGIKTVYFEVQNSAGSSQPVNRTIQLIVKPVLTSFQIDNGAGITSSRTVILNNTATGFPTHYIASQSSTFSGAAWKPYSTAPPFTLSAPIGNKTVYFKVRNPAGVSNRMKAGIVLY